MRKLIKSYLQKSTGLLLLTCLVISSIYGQDLKADNMLLFQRASGGWFKQFQGKAFGYDKSFTKAQKVKIKAEVTAGEATIDNHGTTKEIRYLLHAYAVYKNPKYLKAAERGINYLLKAQYENGGWPQYYPDKRFYRAEITFNDDAMIHVMTLLRDVASRQGDYNAVDALLTTPCIKAVDKGVSCILKTQIKVNNHGTGWCQQYDPVSLQPAKARSYELPGNSGSETVGIIRFLMQIPDPSKEVQIAIIDGVHWLEKVAIKGFRFDKVKAPGTPLGYDRQLIEEPGSVIWARYYEIGTSRPFFCSRDGIKKLDVSDISYERRNGYAWYGQWAKNLLKRYPKWKAKNSL